MDRVEPGLGAGTPQRALPCPPLAIEGLVGRSVDLESLRLDRHAADLWAAIGARPEVWRSIPSGPFEGEPAFQAWLAERLANPATLIFAILDKTGERPSAAGLFFLLQTDQAMGRTEIGLVYGAALTRRIGGTEGFFLLARHVFEASGYRRLEWRCNPDNTASRRAAERFGFTFEGTLRENLWVKGGVWDTAVYSLLDHEWPATAERMAAWLSPANFSAEGRQLRALAAPT